ncbi:twin-arginine translocase TatA/TatE family subunit [Roseofilum reptotaenium CS-1145]|uniref:Sec-independent protein translocase protein TatA n=1 Tax=Roseofilum reptotaenium AO1-A TaxID=1925591 RepID=A0A1L9QT18_9CYAN|nr:MULTISPECIES: twin-arginine translocase TatA/TatE family subunit [Roseofilum]MBP0028919.1 twin-arginine translocase TatA/TatE family subunit [Roseofilum sp. Guam]MDB9518198.1 twin-arginine translocase TatA/TatE family subunit [Roseofilum reptotaenium CS-1145]OJJ25792.1 Sec-independent protein translocase TatA [Roseofilum reptotaenium AO1-A]
MFGLGLPEIGIIAVVALLIFGPKKIPEMGRAMGKTIRGFKAEMNSESESEVDFTSEANPSDSPKS